MSRAGNNITGGLGGLTKSTELRQRIFFVVFALIVFRLGSFITLPGIDPSVMKFLFEQQRGSILDMFNMFSGGSLERMSIFALGVMPYISASIIMQMMTHVYSPLIQLRKEGERGRKKITKYTRYFTVVLAFMQSLGVANALQNQNSSSTVLVLDPGFAFLAIAVITLVTGTMFLVWLGEQITQRGIGNGISLIIFAGIVAEIPRALVTTFELGRTGAISTLMIIAIFILLIITILFIVFMERALRKILINYPKRQMGNKMYGGESSHLPLKINQAGVIPAIFASALLLLPVTFSNFNISESETFLNLSSYFTQGQPLYMLLYA